MKLLFDENLSPRLPQSLADLYPDSAHVHDCGLGSADDSAQDQSVLHGHPPKLIWIHAANCSTSEIESLMRAAAELVRKFIELDQESYLVLGSRRRPGRTKSSGG